MFFWGHSVYVDDLRVWSQELKGGVTVGKVIVSWLWLPTGILTVLTYWRICFVARELRWSRGENRFWYWLRAANLLAPFFYAELLVFAALLVFFLHSAYFGLFKP